MTRGRPLASLGMTWGYLRRVNSPDRSYSGSSRRLALLIQRYAVAVGGLAYGLTLGLRRARNRELVARIARHFGYAGDVTGRLPVVDFDRATDPETSIVLPAALGGPGNVSEAELIALARLVAKKQPRSILEIGTFDGRTAVTLAANAPADARTVTLDLPPTATTALPIEMRDVSLIEKPASGARFAGSPYAARIAQVYGDSATYDFGQLQVDFAFIDGSHSYEYALSDSRRVRGLLRDGGTILWHDYGGEWEGVTRALDELAQTPDFRGLKRIAGTSLAILELPG